MAESERIQGSTPNFTVASTSRKRFGSDANAKRFQETLLSLDLFPARSAEIASELDANASTSLPVEPVADSRPVSNDEKAELSDDKEREEGANDRSSVTDSYPLLCNSTGCRAPEKEVVDQEEAVDEKSIVPRSQDNDNSRTKNKGNADERAAVSEPIATPEATQQQPIPTDAAEADESQLVLADSEAPTTKPQEIASEDAMEQEQAKPVISELQSTQSGEEDRGRERSKRSENAKATDEFRNPASVQPIENSTTSETSGKVAIPAGLESSPNDNLLPNGSLDDSDLLPKSRRADRLDRDRKSGGDKAESIESQSDEPTAQFLSGSIDAAEASLSSTQSLDAVVGAEAASSGEMTTAGFTETTDSVVAAVSSNNALPAITISTTPNEPRMASAAGSIASINTEGAASLGAAFGSDSGAPRSGAATGSASGASSVRGSLTPFQENKLVQRVLKGFEQLQDGGGQVRLRLHPPELGTLQMTLRIESMQVSARLEVENTVARDALIQNAQTLKDQLAAQGFEVERFEVEIRSEVGGDSAGAEDRSDRGGDESRYQSLESRYAAMQANRVGVDSREPQQPASRATWFRNGNNLDLTV